MKSKVERVADVLLAVYLLAGIILGMSICMLFGS
jgi:hypothetical protein